LSQLQTLFLTLGLILNIATSYSNDELSLQDFNKVEGSHQSMKGKNIKKSGRASASLNNEVNSYESKAAKEISRIFQSSLIQSTGIKNK